MPGKTFLKNTGQIICTDPDSMIFYKEKNLILTDEGLQAAREIFSRHSFFERLLIDAGVDEGQAHEDACSLEHAISRQSFAVLKDRLEGLAAQKAAD